MKPTSFSLLNLRGSILYHMAQPARFLSQDNRTDMGIPVFWVSSNSDPPWHFEIWFDQFLLVVTVKENVDPEVLLKEPRAVLEESLPQPETQLNNEDAQAVIKREAQDRLARERVLLENEERGAGTESGTQLILPRSWKTVNI